MDVGMRYFYEAARLGSMSLASEKLGLAVSSISRQITQLESYLGVPLIERGRRSIKLTEAGEAAFKHYQNYLAAHASFRSEIDDLRGIKTGTISLALGEGFLASDFTRFIGDFSEANPGISITLTVGGTSEILRQVLDDEAHLGLVLRFPPEPKIRIRASAAQPLVAFAHPSHPLAELQAVSLAQLANFSLCLGPPGFRIQQMVMEAEIQEKTHLSPRVTTNSIFAMKELARTGGMVTVLPLLAGAAEISTGHLVARPLIAACIETPTIHLISRLGRQLPGAPLRLLSLLEARVKAWDQEARNLTAATALKTPA